MVCLFFFVPTKACDRDARTCDETEKKTPQSGAFFCLAE